MYGRPLVKSGSRTMPTRPASEVEFWPYSGEEPWAPQTERLATKLTFAGFWLLEPATRGSQTWIVPQPRPVLAASQARICV